MFGDLIHHLTGQAHDWTHKLTAGLGIAGLGLTAFPFATAFDWGVRILGGASIAVAIVCSIRKELRESRLYQSQQQAKASQAEGECRETTTTPGHPGDDARPTD